MDIQFSRLEKIEKGYSVFNFAIIMRQLNNKEVIFLSFIALLTLLFMARNEWPVNTIFQIKNTKMILNISLIIIMLSIRKQI